jgi:hypothetical protein
MERDKLTHLEESLLAAVAALGEDAYGLAVYNKLCELEEDPNQGSMYVTLDRLERKGYLVSQYTLPLPESRDIFHMIRNAGALRITHEKVVRPCAKLLP